MNIHVSELLVVVVGIDHGDGDDDSGDDGDDYGDGDV